MATINNAGLPTLLDLAKRQDPNGSIAHIAEVLQIDSPLIQDIPWKEANGPDGHMITLRTALPSLTWRKYNQGILPSKSATGQFTETLGMLEGISKVDCALAERNGNEAAFRASEDLAFVQSYSRYLETAFFYSSAKTAPEQITGLAPRLDALANPYSSQIIRHDLAASGNDQSSIWLVGWGDHKIYGIHPKDSPGGLQMKDLGENLETAPDGVGQLRMYRSHFAWKCGLVVEDARYLVRICNIDATNLSSTGNALIQSMMTALEQIQSLDGCRPVFYMNRTIRAYLRRQAVDTVKNSTLTFENVAGKPVMMLSGVPIHRTDALLSTESVVA